MAHLYFALKHFTRQENFSLVQIDSICRQQFHSGSKFFSNKKKNIVVKRRNLWFPAFSPFHAFFFLFFPGREKTGFFEKGLTLPNDKIIE